MKLISRRIKGEHVIKYTIYAFITCFFAVALRMECVDENESLYEASRRVISRTPSGVPGLNSDFPGFAYNQHANDHREAYFVVSATFGILTITTSAIWAETLKM